MGVEMAYSVQGHILRNNGNPVAFTATPNQGPVGSVRPLYLIMHYTAGPTAAGAINWLANSQAQASAHLVIDRNGQVTQMVAFNRRAWHAGVSRWQELESMNSYSIGIELVNAGKLKKVGNRWENWAGNVIPAAEVEEATHKHETSSAGWQVYPTVQIEAALDVALALHATYRFLDVLGHEDVSRGRKVDPGPAFPMSSFASRVIGRNV